jgi:chaperone modulatory protein CbpM
MIRETEFIARFTNLEQSVLLTWIEDGVVIPERDEHGYIFDHVDQSRVALACDLHYRMGLEHASLPIILSLIDQLHDARHHLHRLAQIVSNQPQSVQQDIADRLASARKAWRDEQSFEK